MGRPKKTVESNTAPIVDDEKTTIAAETVTEETSNEPVKAEEAETKPVEEKNEAGESVAEKKEFGENDKVIIKCESLAGKKLSLPTRYVDFDENGKCEVTGTEANRLLTIPGYELAK